MQSVVGIAKIHDHTCQSDVSRVLFTLLDSLKDRQIISIQHGSTLMIKVNICSMRGFETGATVDPLLVRTLIEWLNREYRDIRILVGEADATELNADLAFEALCWKKTLGSIPNVELINLSKDDSVKVRINGLFLHEVSMSKKYMNSDFLISVGKLKTHTLCRMTCILKNQFGAIALKNKIRFHDHLNEVICDSNAVRKPNLCVVDGVVAMEGEGPTTGMPKPLGLILVGNDAVAIDSACAGIIGLEPKDVDYIRLAIKSGLGNIRFEEFGLSLNDVKTRFVHPSSLRRMLLRTYRSKLLAKSREVFRNIR